MDREYTINTIYDIINSGIIREDLEEYLMQIALAIERDNWTGEIEPPCNGRGC